MSRTLVQSFMFGREHEEAKTREVPWARLVLVGRFCLGAIFVLQGAAMLFDWSSTAAYMSEAGLPIVNILLAIAAAVEILGGLSIITGTFTRLGALALLVILIPATLVFHHFWTLEGAERQAEIAMFLKNLGIAGGLLILLGYGAGTVSIDKRLKDKLDAAA